MVESGFATQADIDTLRALFIGMEAPFPFVPAAPWVPMYGQTLLIASYPVLFAKIGAIYGGDGVTTFGLPDARGRSIAGQDNMGGTAAGRLTSGGAGINGNVLGAAGGAQTVALSLAQMPAHKHNVSIVNATSLKVINSNTAGILGIQGASANGTTELGVTSTVTEATQGSGTAHNNVQPTIVQIWAILAS